VEQLSARQVTKATMPGRHLRTTQMDPTLLPYVSVQAQSHGGASNKSRHGLSSALFSFVKQSLDHLPIIGALQHGILNEFD